MKLLVADDHALFRKGLALALVEAFGENTEIVDAASHDEALEVLRREGGMDFVLCDLSMPGAEAFEALTQIVRASEKVPVVVISASNDAEAIRSAIHCGVRGYIPKQDSFTVLRSALDLIAAGGSYFPAQAFVEPDRSSSGGSSDHISPAAQFQQLSDRQGIILQLLGKGLSNKEIARILGVAEGTVKAQLRSVYKKLGIRNRTEAALLVNSAGAPKYNPSEVA